MDIDSRLPKEIMSIIFYKFGGLEHPTSRIIKEYVNYNFSSQRCFCCMEEVDYCMDPYEEIELTTINPNWIYHKLPFNKKYLLDSYEPKEIHVCFSCSM